MIEKKIKSSAAPEYPVQSDIERQMNKNYESMLHSMNVTILYNLSQAFKNQNNEQ